jgi:hypothetical protein
MAAPVIANKKYIPNEDVTVLKDKTRKKIFGGSVRKLKLEQTNRYSKEAGEDAGKVNKKSTYNVKIKNKRNGTVKTKTRAREKYMSSGYTEYYKKKQLSTPEQSERGDRYIKFVKPLAGNLSKENVKKAIKGGYGRNISEGSKELKGRPGWYKDSRFAKPVKMMEKGKPKEFLNNPNTLIARADCTPDKRTGRCQNREEYKRERILKENAPKKGMGNKKY